MSTGPRQISDEETARIMRWRTRDDLIQRKAGIERLAGFVQAALDGGRAPQSSALDLVHDVLDVAWKGLDRTQHPDDFDRYGDIIGLLARLWLDDDEAEALYLGGREL